MYDPLIFGRNDIEGIVSLEVKDGIAQLFIENENGIKVKEIKNRYWILAPRTYRELSGWFKLKGNLHYQYGMQFNTRNEFLEAKSLLRGRDIYSIYDDKESLMVKDGVTYFKNLKLTDVSVLSFDIETTTLDLNDKAKVLLISNTFKKGDRIEKKLFAYDDYETPGHMFVEWCNWVRSVDPSVITGHNIFAFDLMYIKHCADQLDVPLKLGRDGTEARWNDYISKKRKDQTQDLHYYRCFIYGREIIDTMFLAINYDIATKKYESYGLKSIIKTEGLEKEDRTFYDASKIRFNYENPIEWDKIKTYCKDDSDDALALYFLMAPSSFLSCQMIPKSFQSVGYSATGSQINSMMVRSYLQDGHSIPQATLVSPFEGAISLGYSGVYSNCWKVDVSGLYPSIMIQYEVHDKVKDPNGNFTKIIYTLTEERLKNKKIAKETGNTYYKDLEQSQKILANSCYGFMGTQGLNFNFPEGAEFITRTGREILNKAIDWSKEKSFTLVNADTDSIMICRESQSAFSSEERKQMLDEINTLYPSRINWEDDGYYLKVIILKAKNYILWDGKKLKYKGSATKASTKEIALKEFIKKIIDSMLNDSNDYNNIYKLYVKEAINVQDIKRWVTRKSITQNVLKAKRTNEQKVLDVIKGTEYTEGDRIYTYFKEDGALGLVENFDGKYDKDKLLHKLYQTANIFKTVLPVNELFKNYKLKRNKVELNELFKGGSPCG